MCSFLRVKVFLLMAHQELDFLAFALLILRVIAVFGIYPGDQSVTEIHLNYQ